MYSSSCDLALQAFHRSATAVPAYRQLLHEAAIPASEIKTIEDFYRLPVLDKQNTFQRFPIAQLCVDGELGSLATVVTSSGHSGIFAFGLTDPETASATVKFTDDLLDGVFGVRSQSTLLVNCLPMGVKIHTAACTLAETSVRSDMVVGLVKAFGQHFAQIILCGDAAFLKSVLELGERSGILWSNHRIHVAIGEEILAENARKYFERMIGTDSRRPGCGLVCSSMGIGEIGMHLFTEGPPVAPLIALRRALHEDAGLRKGVIGDFASVPSLFTYDPRRLFVEFDSTDQLIITTLHPHVRCPLIRYASGDRGRILDIPPELEATLERKGIPIATLQSVPLVMIDGRGKHATSGEDKVSPEAVKEGIYKDWELASLTTANFRLASGRESVGVRIQLSPGIKPSRAIQARFASAISGYVDSPLNVICQSYDAFGSGMTVDYERKFDYLGH